MPRNWMDICVLPRAGTRSQGSRRSTAVVIRQPSQSNSPVSSPSSTTATPLLAAQLVVTTLPASAKQKLCTDTCYKAKDGVCDEGRGATSTTSLNILCDLGTDCSDCGEFSGPLLDRSEWAEGGPVAYLVKQQVKLLTRMTETEPAMQMMFTDPEVDLDVSAALVRDKVVENGITQVFHQVLEGRCFDPATGQRALVLDVGANFGYFAVYAALHGCRVVAWEPVRRFRAFIEQNLQLNRVAHLVEVRGAVASTLNGTAVEMQMPTAGIWGTASVDGINQMESHSRRCADAMKELVPSERVDSRVDEAVLLMKQRQQQQQQRQPQQHWDGLRPACAPTAAPAAAQVDVEGYESEVLNSAYLLLAKHEVSNIVLEYNARVAEVAAINSPANAHLLKANPTMLLKLVLEGYRIGQMNDNVAKGGGPIHKVGLPELPEVTLHSLMYDMQDTFVYHKAATSLTTREPHQEREGLGCPVDPALTKVSNAWLTCNVMPEDAHPMSFRSFFIANTNIWATKEHSLMKVMLQHAMGLCVLLARAVWLRASGGGQDGAHPLPCCCSWLQLQGLAQLLQPSQNPNKEWNSANPELGSGTRKCEYLPGWQLVRNRCNCTWAERRKLEPSVIAVCKHEEAIVLSNLASGKWKWATSSVTDAFLTAQASMAKQPPAAT
ncbi:hypothetical protein QJQ45_029574 [Haematococcus lacustris]|nr:hypothetical protein QJQ45_029574 [Haematococcus lacustris]